MASWSHRNAERPQRHTKLLAVCMVASALLVLAGVELWRGVS